MRASTPYRAAPVTVSATSAVQANIFVGMQPTLRQVPPNVPPSTIPIDHESISGLTTELPEPEPTTSRSRESITAPR